MKNSDAPLAIASVFVDPRVLDYLLEELIGSRVSRLPWFVFLRDADLMSALHLQWGDSFQLTPVLVPRKAAIDLEAVQSILDSEGVAPGNCAWIMGPGTDALRPCDRWIFDASDLGPAALAHALVSSVSGYR